MKQIKTLPHTIAAEPPSTHSNGQRCSDVVGAFGDAHVCAKTQLRQEIHLLRARLEAQTTANIELFSLLVEHAAEVLPEDWSAVADVIASEEKFWVYPSASAGQIEDETLEAFIPFLSRHRLRAEWPELLEHARKIYECQVSGRRHGYEY